MRVRSLYLTISCYQWVFSPPTFLARVQMSYFSVAVSRLLHSTVWQWVTRVVWVHTKVEVIGRVSQGKLWIKNKHEKAHNILNRTLWTNCKYKSTWICLAQYKIPVIKIGLWICTPSSRPAFSDTCDSVHGVRVQEGVEHAGKEQVSPSMPQLIVNSPRVYDDVNKD